MMTTLEIEVIVSRFFVYRQNLIVPNISWGMGLHECDLLILSKSNYATEVEIKTSRSDLKKDKNKYHKHKSNKIKYLYFAIPSYLAKDIEHIPLHAGILVITSTGGCYCIAKPKMNVNARSFTEQERIDMLRLGALRIWALKATICNLRKYIKDLKKENWEHVS